MSDERCQVEMYGGKPCNRQSKRNGECIFHLENKDDAESKLFEFEFWEELNRMEEDKNVKVLDFTGFVFPCFISLNGHFFEKPVYFSVAKFNKEADFYVAKFNEKADFSGARFNKEADFSKSEFFNIVLFKGTQFPSDSKETNIILFRNVKFHKPKEVKFHNVDLSNFSFLNTDVTEIEFLDEIWARKGSRLTVVDETLVNKEKGVTYDAVAQLYRRLRRNYETNLRFAEAGDFFIGEMEMCRLDVKARFKNKVLQTFELWLKRNFSLTAWYKHLSYYGESALRPTLWAIGTMLSFSLINYWLLGRTEEGYLKNLVDSITTFFQLRTETTFDIFERLLSIPILGLLFIALKRKFERRK